MYRKGFISGIIIVLLLAVFVSAASAETYLGTVTFTCVNADAAGSGPHVLDRDNTGTGQEQMRVDITDGAGTLIYTLTFSNVLGSFAGGMGDFFYTTPPQYNPITFTVTSLAGNGLPEVVHVYGTGTCAGLPTLAVAGPTCTLPLPSGSVVGEMPGETQAYWAPGEVSPGVIINPGTYHVIGQDASGGYYKIMMGCAYLWVPIESMQPSFQPPQSGASLPTRVVE